MIRIPPEIRIPLCAVCVAAEPPRTPTPPPCMVADKPQLLTKGNDLNLVANDVVFHHGTQRCNVTSITSVVADLAALGASVSQASATSKQDLVQGLSAAGSALADLATKTSKDLAAEAKQFEAVRRAERLGQVLHAQVADLVADPELT